jgi:hypothetical protein
MRAKIGKLFIFLYAVSFFIAIDTLAVSQDWRELNNEHFIVYSTGDINFPKEVADRAEVYYRRIATDLGYPRYSEFWTWDKRVKIYIYPDHASFIAATGQPKWSEGVADYKKKEIISYAWSEGFLESLLPHEMAHLIFRDFVGFKGEIPLWLDEGVAQWAEEFKKKQVRAMARDAFENDSFLSLKDMMNLDIRKIQDSDRLHIRPIRTKDGEPGILFLSTENLINTYYLEAVSLVSFLIERYGSTSFAAFCRQLRDGKTVEEALRFAYPSRLTSIEQFEERWREYLTEEQ